MDKNKKQFERVNKALLVRAPAKINLSLLIAGKRSDGYHNIETIMAKINFFDELLIEKSRKQEIELVCRGSRWAPAGKDNLIYRACEMLAEESHRRINVKITLTKNIPAGSGLGSASSDAASTLIGVNKLLQLNLGRKKLLEMASKLGSDVPFFLNGPQALCTGRGENVEKLEKFFDFCAILVLPDVSISTKMVYNKYKHSVLLYKKLNRQINQFLRKKRVDLVAKMCANMLQKSCFTIDKGLKHLGRQLETIAGEGWCMSGSGSAMFKIINQTDAAKARQYCKLISEGTGCECIIVNNIRW